MVRTRKRAYGEVAQVDSAALDMDSVMAGAIPQVVHCILSHLPACDICKLGSLCREWNKVALSNQLWKEICERDGVDLQKLTEHFQADKQSSAQRLCYMLIYKKYWFTLRKWTTGEGVTTFSKTLGLNTPNAEELSGRCLTISSQYIFTQPKTGTDHTVYVFSASTGAYSHQLDGFPEDVSTLCLSDDETKVAAHAYEASAVCIWTVQDGQDGQALHHPETDQIITMTMHNLVLAVGLCCADETSASVYLWSMESGQLLHQLQGPKVACELAMDAQHLAVYYDVGYRNEQLWLWHVTTGKHMLTWTDTDSFTQILLHNTTNSLVARESSEKAVKIWDTETGERKAWIEKYSGTYAVAMHISGNNLVVLYAKDDSTESIDIVDLRSCTVFESVDIIPSSRWFKNAVSVSNGLVLVNPKGSSSMQVWNIAKRKFIRVISFDGPIVDFIASFQQLRLVLDKDNKLIFKKYTFGV